MVERTESSEPNSGLAWPALAVLSFAAVVYFSGEQPFRHSRPVSEATKTSRGGRLWSDPFAVKANDQLWRDGYEPREKRCDKVFVVMVPPGNLPAARESRRRTRYALHASPLRRVLSQCPTVIAGCS